MVAEVDFPLLSNRLGRYASALVAPFLIPAAEERSLWMEVLEAEERARLHTLRARTDALVAEEHPAPAQIGDLLVSALQSQTTLARLTRLFPLSTDSARIDKARALDHAPTTELACQLRRCWSALGVTATTQKVILREALLAVGTSTARVRARFFGRLDRALWKESGLKPHEGFAAEGSGQQHIFRLCSPRFLSPLHWNTCHFER